MYVENNITEYTNEEIQEEIPECLQKEIEYINKYSFKNYKYYSNTNEYSTKDYYMHHYINVCNYVDGTTREINPVHFFLYTMLIEEEYNKLPNNIHCTACNKKNKDIVRILDKEYKNQLCFSAFQSVELIRSIKFKPRILGMNIIIIEDSKKNLTYSYDKQPSSNILKIMNHFLNKHNKCNDTTFYFFDGKHIKNDFENIDSNIIVKNNKDFLNYHNKVTYCSCQSMFYSYMLTNQINRNNCYNEEEINAISKLINLKHIHTCLKYISDSLAFIMKSNQNEYSIIEIIKQMCKKTYQSLYYTTSQLNQFSITLEFNQICSAYKSLSRIIESDMYKNMKFSTTKIEADMQDVNNAIQNFKDPNNKEDTIDEENTTNMLGKLNSISKNITTDVYNRHKNICSDNTKLVDKYTSEYSKNKYCMNSYIYKGCTI